jgi:hypothetical protein
MKIRGAFSTAAFPALMEGLIALALSPLSALAQDGSVLTYTVTKAGAAFTSFRRCPGRKQIGSAGSRA